MSEEAATFSKPNEKHAAEIVSDVLALYATMLNGQICTNSSLSLEERLAAVICASEVLHKAHTKVMAALAAEAQGGPAWLVGAQKLEETADLYFRRMVGG